MAAFAKSIRAGRALVKEYALRQVTTESSVREFPYIKRVGEADLMGDAGLRRFCRSIKRRRSLPPVGALSGFRFRQRLQGFRELPECKLQSPTRFQ